MSNLLHKYQNGNVAIEIFADGTKIREWPDNEKPNVEWPESCDLKITQYCDMDAVCVYCHEMSNKQGKHGDLKLITSIWNSQLRGTELAIGGGNPLAHPGLSDFLQDMKIRGIICNVTVNMLHMKKHADEIRGYQQAKKIYGLGISYRGKNSLKMLPEDIDYSNVVFHMIMGVHDLDDCLDVIEWCSARNIVPKLLLLGYKTFGNGVGYYSPELQVELDNWKNTYLKMLLAQNRHLVVSFDNLAIKQLDLKSQVPTQQWLDLYQGDDGEHTFYIDAVEQTVARTSTSNERFPIKEHDDIRDLFRKVRL
jgi:MoaA/NifB/PqqE/SkfB family radical SAM enzyme